MKTTLMQCTACGIESEACEKCPVCGTATDLDRLTRTVTAFGTWGEMVAAMEGGYCPTLRPATRKPRGRKQQEWEAAVATLAGRVRAAGFRVYDGRTVS